MADALISLGSNLGDRGELLNKAVARLQSRGGIEVAAISRWYATTPVGGPSGQPDYLNGAARLRTTLNADALLDELFSVEAELGRQRSARWSARTVDLDLLLHGQQIRDTPRLSLPHPRMAFRRFVLQPAAEVGGDMVDPQTGWTIARLLEHLDATPDYLAVSGHDAVQAQRIVRQVAQALSCQLALRPPVSDAIGSSGQSMAANLESLSQLAELVASFDVRRCVISDFWFDSVWFKIRQLAFAIGNESDLQLLRNLKAKVAPPKLLVLLSDPSDAADVDLRDYVRHEYRRPTLILNAPSDEVAVMEISAAMQAMRRS
ncbi:MAG: 2-amino-4-hydroxy-6-hydroxymethyldihydropteridine diphosphokinase [Planctomycetales bacterium]|nr:2-amino-4-hydroxy-6-hydroxymethyldihydropteridine diphosphokinase [Planctomycetales bacterium]